MKNLKSLMFGLVALVLAFGLVFGVSAFRSQGKPQLTTTTFYYNGPLPADKDDVENAINWKYDANNQNCGLPQDEQACTITVSNDFVDDSGDEPILESSIELVGADHSSLSAAYIVGSADGNMLISNRYY